MINRAKQIIASPLFLGSVLMIAGGNATNAINYVYHLLMGRLLGPSNYGELVVLISLIGFLGIIPSSLGLVVVKYVSSSKTNKEVGSLITWLNKKSFIFALIILLLISLTSPFISSFLKIDSASFVILIGIAFLFGLPAIFNRSALQGLLRFKQILYSIIAENITKLFLGIFLVYAGFAVGGAMIALVIAGFLGWLLARKFIGDYLYGNTDPGYNVNQLLLYSVPVLVQSLATTSLYSADLILVKHFFSAHEAGIYSSLSMLGKIIFFGAGPISSVMFPLVAKRQSEGQDYKRVFSYSFILTLLLSLVVVVTYWLLPQLVISTLYGSSYLEGANLLVWFGIFITLFTLSSLLINFYLSLGKTKTVAFPLLAAISQILGIWFFHDSLQTVITVSITVTALLLLNLIIYLIYATKASFNNSPGLSTRENYSPGFNKN